MNKCYYRIVWENYPSDKTPLNEQNLNKIDVAADEMDNRIISLDSTKFDKAEAQQLVKYIEYDDETGIFKITHYNGASYTIDTLLEKLAINFDYDYQTQRLIIELSDGTVKYVDLSALLTQYEFLDSETAHFTVSTDGKVTVDIKEGSIKEKHLQPNYLADIKVEEAKAQMSATNAAESATAAENSKKLSESYAHGGTGIREGEDTDNAKKYKELAEQAYENLQKSTVTGVKGDAESTYRQGNINLTPENIGAFPGTVMIPTNSNLNDYFSPGAYYYASNAALLNMPIEAANRAGCIIVLKENTFRRQILFSASDTDKKTFFRERKTDTTWTEWINQVTQVKGDAESDYRGGQVNLTPANIGALPSTTKYAASDSAGGPADSLKDFSVTKQTDLGKDQEQNAIGYVGSMDVFDGVSDGAMFEQAYSSLWGCQIYGDYRTGQIATRGKNTGEWQPWRKQLDEYNYTTLTPKLAPQVHCYNTGVFSGGYHKIKLIDSSHWMLSFEIMIYQDYVPTIVLISGYNYGDSHWYAPKAEIVATNEGRKIILVKFGYDDDGFAWVAIPNGNYYGVTVCNINNGYMQVNGWADKIEITNVETLSGTLQSEVTAYAPVKSPEITYVRKVSSLPSDAASHPDTLYVIPG